MTNFSSPLPNQNKQKQHVTVSKVKTKYLCYLNIIGALLIFLFTGNLTQLSDAALKPVTGAQNAALSESLVFFLYAGVCMIKHAFPLVPPNKFSLRYV